MARIHEWPMAMSIAAIACFAVACGSNENEPAGPSPGNLPGGSSGSAANTAGSRGAATGGSGGTTAIAGRSAPTPAGIGGESGATGAGQQGGTSSSGRGGSGGAEAGAGGMMARAGIGAAGSGTAGTAGPVDGPDNNAPCTVSKAASANVSGTGQHEVIVETNSDPGINEGTIYRPADLEGAERFPIFVWGEGGCARQGLSNQVANGEIASHGYFVIADGTPSGGGGNRSLGGADAGKPMIAYIDWAIAENNKPCSVYYHKLDITKIATNGFSCGGLMAQGTAGDPRLTTWMINSSGGFSANQALYDATHGPVLIVQGGPSDIAYENGKRDYENLAKLTHPIMFFSKDIGHGGDLFSRNGGNFTRLNLAWLNWWLKGDETAAGKGFLIGDGCTLCKDSTWEVTSANVR